MIPAMTINKLIEELENLKLSSDYPVHFNNDTSEGYKFRIDLCNDIKSDFTITNLINIFKAMENNIEVDWYEDKSVMVRWYNIGPFINNNPIFEIVILLKKEL